MRTVISIPKGRGARRSMVSVEYQWSCLQSLFDVQEYASDTRPGSYQQFQTTPCIQTQCPINWREIHSLWSINMDAINSIDAFG